MFIENEINKFLNQILAKVCTKLREIDIKIVKFPSLWGGHIPPQTPPYPRKRGPRRCRACPSKIVHHRPPLVLLCIVIEEFNPFIHVENLLDEILMLVNLVSYVNQQRGSPWLDEFEGSQLDIFCPKAIVYCYLDFKLRYLKNLKLFSIRVKELSEPMVLWKRQRV